MTAEYEFELKLASGKMVTWNGTDGIDAARRYADAHRGETVIAWQWPRYGVFPGVKPEQIIG